MEGLLCGQGLVQLLLRPGDTTDVRGKDENACLIFEESILCLSWGEEKAYISFGIFALENTIAHSLPKLTCRALMFGCVLILVLSHTISGRVRMHIWLWHVGCTKHESIRP